jgi:transcriptional regulator with XRE-family HTH domain
MFSVGETLKRARLAQNLDLAELAGQTKINIRYLEAIEADDRQSLPSGFFYKSFIDQYARALSLDTREIDAAVDRVLSAEAPLPLPGTESVVSRNVSPLRTTRRFSAWRPIAMAATLLVVVAACSGVYALWRNWKIPKPQTTAVLVHPAPRPVPVAVPAPPPSAPAPPIAEKANLVAQPEEPGYKVMLDLLARETTWLSVSSDGKPVFSGILEANQTKSVGGKQFAKMRVGNAAGIEVRLNGKQIGPLGARGQVLVVLFTPDNFQIVPPLSESGD